jgi:class 3 adenylate cyclase
MVAGVVVGGVVALIIVALVGAVIALNIFMRRWRSEQAEVRRIKATFSRYVPRAIVEELLDRKEAGLFSGREMRATILVCRIWNFSHFIENLTPEQTLRYLNEFYAMAGTSIERQRGVLHRFLEDGVVGIFGVPLEDPEQEDHALRAAINIVRLVSLMQEKWVQQNRKPLRVGVGINTGDVIAGDAGFAQRREYQVVGPDVTLAHRLAAGTVDLNAYIVVSRATVEPVIDLYNLVPVSGVPLTGVRALLDAFIVRGRKRGDTLVLPKAGAFANTVVDEHTFAESLEPEEVVPFDVVDESSSANAQKKTPAPPPAAEVPFPRIESPNDGQPLKTRRRPRPDDERKPPPDAARPEQQHLGIDLPELRVPSFSGTDEEAIMPDPPPPRATYEDNDGPPVVL